MKKLWIACFLLLVLGLAAPAQRITLLYNAAYSASTTYAVGDVVTEGGVFYLSIAANNKGNDPATSTTGRWEVWGGAGGNSTGAAGGDLGGSYPSPIVTGLHVTSGSIAGLSAFTLGASGTPGEVIWNPNGTHQNHQYADPYLALNTDGTHLLTISAGLPAPDGTYGIGGYYQGVGVGGATSSSQTPIFGVLSSTQSGTGIGNVAFSVTDSNLVETYNNILDDGFGNATVHGNSNVHGGLQAQFASFSYNPVGKYGDPAYTALTANIQSNGTGTPCQPYGGLCTTTIGTYESDAFTLPGQNLYDNLTVYCEGEPGDCVQDRYLYSNGGDAMTNAEGTWQQWLIAESHGNITFICSTGCTTGSQVMTAGNANGLGINAFGVGRLLSAPTIWSGTGANPQTLGTQPFSQVQLSGINVFSSSSPQAAASSFLEIGGSGVTAYGDNVTVPISTSPKYSISTTSTAPFTVGSVVCLSIPNVGGNPDYFGTAQVTAVTSSTISYNHLDYQYPPGTLMATGGLCGYGLENTGVTALDHALQIWPIFGSLDNAGTVLYPQQSNPNIVGNQGLVALHPIAKIESATVAPGNGSDYLILSPNLVSWNTSDTVTESHGRSIHIGGQRIFIDQATPGPFAHIASELSESGFAAGGSTDRVLKLDISSPLNGTGNFAFVEADGPAAFFAQLDTSQGGFWFANNNCGSNPVEVFGFAAGSSTMDYTCNPTSGTGTDFTVNTNTAHFGTLYVNGTRVIQGNGDSEYGQYSGNTTTYGFSGPGTQYSYSEMQVGRENYYTLPCGGAICNSYGTMMSFWGNRSFNGTNPQETNFLYMGVAGENNDNLLCIEFAGPGNICHRDQFDIGASWTVNPSTGNTTIGGTLTVTGATTLTGGSIDGTLIGQTTPSSGVFNYLTVNTRATIYGGLITGTPISGASGSFTSLADSGNLTVTGNGTINGTLNSIGSFSAQGGASVGGSVFAVTSGQIVYSKLASQTGYRYLCIDPNGYVTSSATACSGT